LKLNEATYGTFEIKWSFDIATERIKMPKRGGGVNWAFINFIARIKTY
jgi:hypothetical protein